MARCKACGAPIVWIKLASGKNMPCDPESIEYEEDPTGPMILVVKDGRVIHARESADSKQYGYISHYATCPAAKQFRRRG